MYKLLKTDGRAKRAEMHTVHGVIQTPVFIIKYISSSCKTG